MSEDLIKVFFHMNLNIKLFHWQTNSYAKHVASDALHSSLLDLIDKFVEVYIGRYPKTFDVKMSVNVKTYTNESIVELMQKYKEYLENDLPMKLHKSDTELLNIRDEMLEIINKTLYLFRLN